MKRKKQPLIDPPPAYPKPKTAEARDNQLIALSYDLVEQRMRDGTATSQETTYFLKLAAQREKAQLELQIMEKQKELLEAKTESLQSAKRMEELYSDAIKAFTSYGSSALFRTDDENIQ